MTLRKLRVLCIEDEPDLLEDISQELTESGYDVLQARSGVEGLATIFDESLDLVICDVRMPGLDGIGLLNEIKQRGAQSTPPFIMLSAFSDQALHSQVEALGASAFVVKPVDYAELISLIAKVLGA